MKAKMITVSSERVGPCVFEVWDNSQRKMVRCGKPGHEHITGKGRYGPALCEEHGEFYIDAYNR